MKQFLAFIFAVFTLSSCSHKTTPTIVVVSGLAGTWQVLSVNGVAIVKKDAGKEMPYLEFNTTNNTVTGTAGCNRLNGKATFTRTSIDFGPIATTMMMCPNAKYEREILQTLIGNLSYTLESNVITISKEGRNVMTLGR
jgi:heat shock protein HslJ